MNDQKNEKAMNVSYSILSSEFDGLLIVAKRELNTYKFFISKKILGCTETKEVYDPIITKNMVNFIEGVGNGFYRRFFDGYLVDRVIAS
ncbi:MAG: hypothetical protein SGJ15_07310 [Bacteroidota bacterium]|nr:hypothetical protein [Bacteroidota bacterium]